MPSISAIVWWHRSIGDFQPFLREIGLFLFRFSCNAGSRLDLFRSRPGLETDPLASLCFHLSQLPNQPGARNLEQASGLSLVVATVLVDGADVPPHCAIQ
jgi:hypothetical protein